MSDIEARRWEPAGIKRAAKRVGKLHEHDATVRFPRADQIFVQAASGRGMTWEEDGRKMRAQAWCPGPYIRSYWYLVWEKEAYFPGELRLFMTDAEGHVWLHDTHSYNARGHKAHRHDGSSCFGYQIGGCPGCNRERELKESA